jgi:hypothetical protein
MEKNVLSRELAKVNYLIDETRAKREQIRVAAEKQLVGVNAEIGAVRQELARAGIGANVILTRRYRALLDRRARLARVTDAGKEG